MPELRRLIVGGKPVGGPWGFDVDNREAFGAPHA
jgi:deoxyribodipyrimidine photolyase-like uncharacterized protein